MNFDSIEYVLFLLLVVGVFATLPGRARVPFLLAASLAFYSVWSVPLTALILISGLTDFGVGMALGRTEQPTRRKLLLLLSVAVNLGILGYFKYRGFFLDNLHALGLVEQGSVVDVLLPPGISFYTFQTMSYTIDVYRRELQPTRSPTRFLLYVSFFPQLIAGPIERASSLLPQLEALARHRVASEDVAVGLRLIVFGLFKKVVLADYCAVLADRVFADPAAYGGWASLCACLLFTLQIYFDFSAYSEIAKGSARVLGVELIWNFDQPYLAPNVSEFWRRWHISLSNWFRDYVYKPLGGSQAGKGRVLFNLGATMFVSGLWHGAAWNFVLWGLFHGLLLLLHHQLRARAWVVKLRDRAPRVFGFATWAWTLHAVILGWLLFRVEHLADIGVIGGSIGRALVGGESITEGELGIIVGFYTILAVSLAARRLRLLERIQANASVSLVFYAGLAAAAILLARDQASAFIYFQF
ncbi:putative poly(beta-D-mannuronate) O-acetylase [Enhygromyxa salina]|uniref:Putative poly(Beta-D-mannuronate) O-acetylase n=1 Tax=Enhygromyxa salina TaxID=215803 RepID=A0A0C2D1N9_9BACT|nr:MBOAT family O-acyltransferase [Enhygromyxa salina]KIG14082.1 putative poly(beta-D-mannuronate) O-acetylase [Enhygromyxa salina]